MRRVRQFRVRRRKLLMAGIALAIVWPVGANTAWSTPPERLTYPLYISSTVWSIAFSPDGKLLAWGEGSSVESETSNVTKVWNLATKERLYTLRAKDQYEVRAVAFSPDGKILASGSWPMCFWDPASGKKLWSRPVSVEIRSMAFSPDGKSLAMGTGGGGLLLWDVGTRTILASLKGHVRDVNSVAFSPDGRLLASAASDKTVRIWDVAARKEVKKLEGHGDGPNRGIRYIVRSVAWSPNGTMLASGGGDETVRLWDVATGKQTAKLEGSAPYY
ncbi:MAG: WD40 repeat domain-containing protein [Pirellulales bacterium]